MGAATERRKQVEHARGERRRQRERFERIEAMRDYRLPNGQHANELRTHHGWGVCVKARDVHCTCEADEIWTTGVCSCGYALVQEIFFDDCREIAHEHGFDDIYTAGRNSGYVLVAPQPDYENWWEHEIVEHQRTVLGPFVCDVLDMLAQVRALWREGKCITGETLAELVAPDS